MVSPQTTWGKLQPQLFGILWSNQWPWCLLQPYFYLFVVYALGSLALKNFQQCPWSHPQVEPQGWGSFLYEEVLGGVSHCYEDGHLGLKIHELIHLSGRLLGGCIRITLEMIQIHHWKITFLRFTKTKQKKNKKQNKTTSLLGNFTNFPMLQVANPNLEVAGRPLKEWGGGVGGWGGLTGTSFISPPLVKWLIQNVIVHFYMNKDCYCLDDTT